MNIVPNQSEIARLREQLAAEYIASQRGLVGFASGTARHDFISARMENMGVIHERLIELVGSDEAIKIVANSVWTPADQGTALAPRETKRSDS